MSTINTSSSNEGKYFIKIATEIIKKFSSFSANKEMSLLQWAFYSVLAESSSGLQLPLLNRFQFHLMKELLWKEIESRRGRWRRKNSCREHNSVIILHCFHDFRRWSKQSDVEWGIIEMVGVRNFKILSVNFLTSIYALFDSTPNRIKRKFSALSPHFAQERQSLLLKIPSPASFAPNGAAGNFLSF